MNHARHGGCANVRPGPGPGPGPGRLAVTPEPSACWSGEEPPAVARPDPRGIGLQTSAVEVNIRRNEIPALHFHPRQSGSDPNGRWRVRTDLTAAAASLTPAGCLCGGAAQRRRDHRRPPPPRRPLLRVPGGDDEVTGEATLPRFPRGRRAA
jgi:hypothetical protein